MKTWLDRTTLSETLRVLEDLSTRLVSREPVHPVLQHLLSLIKGQRWSELLDYEVDYSVYSSADTSMLITARQLLGFYTKLDCLELGIDTEFMANVNFLEAEQTCKATNDAIRSIRLGRASPAPRFLRVIKLARKKIRMVLGKCPTLDRLAFKFGPGATTTIKRMDTTVQMKMVDDPTCSESLFHSPLFPSFLREIPHWLDCHQVEELRDSDGIRASWLDVKLSSSKLAFVPKNARIKRTIITQPTLDTLYQSGIGDYMVKRLKLAGVDLRDQTRNQKLAREGSLDHNNDLDDYCNGIATLDLQSASDTMSYQLVKLLVDDDWFSLLSSGRCQTYTNGLCNPVRLEQFSSMGNGFTFPLESLIFHSLTWASMVDEGFTADVFMKNLSVYGDDIILPQVSAEGAIEVLKMCGFKVNTKKSFVTGPFRESCGADYFRGIDIRPYYQRTLITGETLFTMHNHFHRLGDFELARMICEKIPEPLRRFGPDGYGDGHLIAEVYPSHRPRAARRCGWGGSYFRTFKRLSRALPSLIPGDYVSPLYVIYTRGASSAFDLASRSYTTDRRSRFAKDGRMMFDLPDTDEYEEVSIYTFG